MHTCCAPADEFPIPALHHGVPSRGGPGPVVTTTTTTSSVVLLEGGQNGLMSDEAYIENTLAMSQLQKMQVQLEEVMERCRNLEARNTMQERRIARLETQVQEQASVIETQKEEIQIAEKEAEGAVEAVENIKKDVNKAGHPSFGRSDSCIIRQEKRLEVLEVHVREQDAILKSQKEELSAVEKEAEEAVVAVQNIDIDVGEEDYNNRRSTKSTLEEKEIEVVKNQGCFLYKRVDDTGTLTYPFCVTIWDAGIILTAGFDEHAGDAWSKWDAFLLFFALISHHAAQVCLLFMVQTHMIYSPYHEDEVQNMLNWRISYGHEVAVDDATGATLVSRVCDGDIWSFQASEYEDMMKYMSPLDLTPGSVNIPGYFMAYLAIVLWVSACVTELRTLLLQLEMLNGLPSKARGGFEMNERQVLVLRHIGPTQRLITICIIVIPRAAIVTILCGLGCIMLSRTVGLPDLILESVALIFVLDIDELTCKVVLPRKVLNIIAGTHAEYQTSAIMVLGGLHLQDFLRYAISLLTIFFVILFYLMPFMDEVRFAMSTVCGGDTTWSWTNQTIPGM